MQYFKYLLLFSLIPLVSACFFMPKSLGELDLHNESGLTLYIETNLQSMFGDSLDQIELTNASNVNLCRSNLLQNTSREITIEEICSNYKTAYVRVYRDNSHGERVLVKEWTYATRDDAGPQFFNMKYLVKDCFPQVDGVYVTAYRFTLQAGDY